jgi:hypothetical protein
LKLSNLDFEDRKLAFGTNVKPSQSRPSFIRLFMRNLLRPFYISLLIIAILSVVIGEAFDNTEFEKTYGNKKVFELISYIALI